MTYKAPTSGCLPRGPATTTREEMQRLKSPVGGWNSGGSPAHSRDSKRHFSPRRKNKSYFVSALLPFFFPGPTFCWSFSFCSGVRTSLTCFNESFTRV